MWVESKQHAINNQCVTEEFRENQQIPEDKWQWKYNSQKLMGHSKISYKGEVYNNTSLSQETRKI